MMTRKHLSVLGFLLLIAAMMPAAPAHAASVLGFDDITDADSQGPLNNYSYSGLTWTNLGVIDASSAPSDSGYANSNVSDDYAAYNPQASALSVRSDSPFTFESAYFTAAWNTGLNIRITGYLDGAAVHQQTILVDPDAATLFDFGSSFSGIEILEFVSFGGTYAELGGEGEQFAMDNFTYSVVPVPAAVWMGGVAMMGLAGAGWLRRRRAA